MIECGNCGGAGHCWPWCSGFVLPAQSPAEAAVYRVLLNFYGGEEMATASQRADVASMARAVVAEGLPVVASTAPAPQPETEWATFDTDGEVRIAADEDEARWIVEKAEPTWTLKCRPVGPWTAVTE